MKSNGWSSKKEKVLKYWQEECRLYVWLHNENARYYRSWDKILSIPAILITAVTGTAVFSTTDNQSEDGRIGKYLIGSMLMIGTFLQSTRDFLDIGNLIYRHSNCAKCYQSLVNDIEEQLTQDREDRENGKQFLHKIKVRKNDIINNGMTISSKTWKKLKIAMNNGEVINLYNTNFFHDYLNNIKEDERHDKTQHPPSPLENNNKDVNNNQELIEVLVDNDSIIHNSNNLHNTTNNTSNNTNNTSNNTNNTSNNTNENSNQLKILKLDNQATNNIQSNKLNLNQDSLLTIPINESNTDSTDDEESLVHDNLDNVNQIQIKNKLGHNFNNLSLQKNNPNKTNSKIKQLNYQLGR